MPVDTKFFFGISCFYIILNYITLYSIILVVVFVDGAETTVSLFSVLSTWEKSFLIKNCMTLLNSYSPAEVRGLSLGKSITLIDKNFFLFFHRL